MKIQRSLRSFLLLCALVLSFGALTNAATAEEAAKAPEAAPAAEVAQPDQYIQFVIDHADSSKGLVNGSFAKFTVKKAVIDLKDLDKSMVELEIDVASVDTKTPPRDEHLKNADFFDVTKFPTASLVVKGVKAVENPGEDDDDYTATATLSLHGVSKDLQVSFSVVDTAADGTVTIEGEYELPRMDFGVGAEPAKSGAAEKAMVKIRLKLKNN